jgi:hypothetical protein
MRAWKLTIGMLSATALVAVLACGPAAAQAGRGGAPHGGGGGVPHVGGGGGGVPHFGGGGAPHFNAAPHINMAPHVGVQHFAVPHVGGRSFAPHVSFGRHGIAHVGPHVSPHMHLGHIGHAHIRTGTHFRVTHAHPLTTRGAHGIVRHGVTHNAGGVAALHGRAAGLHASAHRLSGAASARNFAAHRTFAHAHALRPFLHDAWHRHYHHHLGWIGPLFWPYAYGDVFYYALWPYEYDYYDPFWAYGYDDIYEAIFPSYDYGVYVRGRRGAARMTALKHSVTQSCSDEAAEVTGWPIDQIQAAVAPDQQQRTLLDALGNAVVSASDVIKSHCPSNVAFTAPARLADMQERLQGLVQAIAIVQPPLAKFYDSLSDEQKARFNALGAPAGQNEQGQQAAQTPQSQCGENPIAWPADRIDQAVRPNDEQRAKLDALNAATKEAADAIKAACPSELPATPPDRLAAEAKRLQAILQGVQTIRPKLDDFYASLSNEQKARFNSIGRQLFAAR